MSTTGEAVFGIAPRPNGTALPATAAVVAAAAATTVIAAAEAGLSPSNLHRLP